MPVRRLVRGLSSCPLFTTIATIATITAVTAVAALIRVSGPLGGLPERL